MRRAAQYGFTEAEVQEQLANRRTAFKNAVAGVTTRSESTSARVATTAPAAPCFTRTRAECGARLRVDT